MRSTLRFIGEGADYKSRALFGAAQHAHQFNRVENRLQEFARRSAAEGLSRLQSAIARDGRPRFSGVSLD
jgi:hypothetical protein